MPLYLTRFAGAVRQRGGGANGGRYAVFGALTDINTASQSAPLYVAACVVLLHEDITLLYQAQSMADYAAALALANAEAERMLDIRMRAVEVARAERALRGYEVFSNPDYLDIDPLIFSATRSITDSPS